jgi:putative endonuclease
MESTDKSSIIGFWSSKLFPKLTSYLQGLKAEKVAVKYLKKKGWTIIARNFKTKLGEVDIIAYKGNNLTAFEVKYRGNEDMLYDSISAKQKKRVKNAFLVFLQKRNYYNEDYIFRIDAILINANYKINHIQNAWE